MKDFLDRLTLGRALMVTFVLTALYYFMFYDDGQNQLLMINNTRNEVQRLQTEIQAVEQKLQRSKEYQSVSQNLGNSIQKLLSYIPVNFRIGQLMKTVSEEARLAGLDITQLAPRTVTNPEPMEDFDELSVGFQLLGQYEQVLHFMSNLTQKRQIFVFEKLEMISTPDGPSGLLKVEGEIRAFSYKGGSQ